MDFLEKVLIFLNTNLYRFTRGLLGSKMAGQDVLLLETTGRKSGKHYTTPINYYRDQGNYLVVASNWGKDHHPQWYYNLLHQPETTIQVKDRKLHVRAQTVPEADYERLWKLVSGQNEFYVQYQRATRRKIPLVILSETSNGISH